VVIEMGFEEKYNSYNIVYNENLERWEAFEGGEKIASSDNLKNLKNRLDKIGIERKTFKRFPAYYRDNTRMILVEVTSLAENLSNYDKRKEYWISSKESIGYGGRKVMKISEYNLYEKSDANDALIAKIDEQQKIIDAATEIRTKLDEKMKRLG
jgi:hypothetical protein